jgi:hypothetical protein
LQADDNADWQVESMATGIRLDEVTRIADIVVKTEAALGELHNYHRFGRHLEGFPQRLYFLFSHCAHLLFSLWLIEQDSPTGIFAASSSLKTIINRLDFDTLRYLDYSRRMLYANAYEDHLKNESKWFRFWVKLLQELQGSDAVGCEEFARRFAVCQTDSSLLEGKLGKQDQKVLANLVQSPRTSRLLLHSIWVLEDMISTAGSYIAGLDPRVHAVEQIQSLACLLSQLRGAIVLETQARGPYILSADNRWGTPSVFDRLLCRKTPGLLTVTSGEDRSEIACTYTWDSGGQKQERKWVRSISALDCTYEEALFKTWPQAAPTEEQECATPEQTEARWIVHELEAGHLEAICRHADEVLAGLGKRPSYSGLIECVAHTMRDGRSEWTTVELPWNHVRKLDQLIGRLKFACREAKVLGGETPGEKVAAKLWPLSSASAGETDEGHPTEVPAGSAKEEAPSTHTPEQPEPPAGSVAQAPATEPRIQDPGDLDVQRVDRLSELIGLLLDKEAESGEVQPVSPPACDCSEGNEIEPPSGIGRAANDLTDQVAVQLLVRRLLEWHEGPGRSCSGEPISLEQLQLDLGWSRSRVRQAMSDLFCCDPFDAYERKCTEQSIGDFLHASGVRAGEAIYRSLRQSRSRM